MHKKAVTQANSRQTSRESSPIISKPTNAMQNNNMNNMSVSMKPIIENNSSNAMNRTINSQSVQRQQYDYQGGAQGTSKLIAIPMSQQNSPRAALQTSIDKRQQQQTNEINNNNNNNTQRRLNQSVDFVDRCNISIQDIIKSNMRKTTGDQVFGISGYRLPNTNIITQRPRTTKFTTYNVPHFIDKYTKSREFVPGPKYDTVHDWKNNLRARGQFSKSPRVTFTESVIKENKLLEHPGPGAYKYQDGFKKRKQDKNNVALTDKYCEFIEEAKFVGLETPAPKYEINYNRIDPDLKYARIKPSKVSRMDKIQKDPKQPAPGDYNTLDAYNKTQSVNFVHKIGQSKNSCFVDQYQKAKQFLPGIGSYKVEPKVYSILSKSPVSIRTLRH